MTRLFLSIESLRGVGQKRAQIYRKIGIDTPYDLLYHLPRDYRDYRDPIPVADVQPGSTAVIRVTITEKKRPVYARGRMQIFCLDAVDDDGTPISVRFFNNVYAYQALSVGQTCTMCGKIGGSPAMREIHAPNVLKDLSHPIEAVYPQTTGLTSAMVRTNVEECLRLMDEAPFETLPADMRSRYDLMPMPSTSRNVSPMRRRHAAALPLRKCSACISDCAS